jgi:hypothetical protein
VNDRAFGVQPVERVSDESGADVAGDVLERVSLGRAVAERLSHPQRAVDELRLGHEQRGRDEAAREVSERQRCLERGDAAASIRVRNGGVEDVDEFIRTSLWDRRCAVSRDTPTPHCTRLRSQSPGAARPSMPALLASDRS